MDPNNLMLKIPPLFYEVLYLEHTKIDDYSQRLKTMVANLQSFDNIAYINKQKDGKVDTCDKTRSSSLAIKSFNVHC